MGKIIALKPLTNEALADIFLSMAMKEDDRQNAEKAFTEFYNQYKNFLYTVVKKACEPWKMYGEDLIETVFNYTFLKIYEKADTFIFIDDIPVERQEKKMKSWLCQVAKNEMLQLLRQYKLEKDKIEYTDDLSFIDKIEDKAEVILSDDILLVEKALQSLSKKERDILITYLMYEDANKKLPSSEIKILAEMWGVLPDSLRQIKKRSLAKVETFIKTHKN